MEMSRRGLLDPNPEAKEALETLCRLLSTKLGAEAFDEDRSERLHRLNTPRVPARELR